MKRILKKFIAVLLVIATILIVTTAVVSAATSVSNVGYQLYLADDLLWDLTARLFITGDYICPYRKLVQDRRNNTGFLATVAAWEIATFDLSDIIKYNDKSIAYYEAILFDIFCDSQKTEQGIDNADQIYKSINHEIAKSLVKLDSTILKQSVEELKADPELYKSFVSELEGLECLSDTFEFLGDFITILEVGTNVIDVIDKCAKIQTALVVYTEAGEILDDIASRTSDISLAMACQRFKLLFEKVIDEADLVAMFGVEDSLYVAMDKLVEDLWGMVLDVLTGCGFAVTIGQEMGKLASNMLFSTDALVESFYSMNALYEFEDCIRACVRSYENAYKSSRTYQNALIYNQAFMMLAKTQAEGAEYALKFLDITYEKGIVNECYYAAKEKNMLWMMGLLGAFMDTAHCEYDVAKTTIQGSLDDTNTFIEQRVTESYNDYVQYFKSEYQNSVGQTIVLEVEPLPATEEEMTLCHNDLVTVSELYSNRTFSSATTLTEDVDVYGDAYISADLDLNGHTLNVAGNVYHTNGKITVNNGTLNIVGDYRHQNETVNNIGEIEYSYAGGYLKMTNTNDKVTIGGSFITRSGSSHTLYAGVLTVCGDIYDWNCDIMASDTHRTVLGGSEKQTIYFDNSSSYFNILEATNSNIEFTGYFGANSLGSDITVTSNDAAGYISDLNGKTFTVNGDVTVHGGMNLNGGAMTVNGTVHHTNGKITVNNGTLNITDDYCHQIETVNNIGEAEYTNASGYMIMANANDKVNVGGSFITRAGSSHTLYAGVLTVCGDIYDWTYDIMASDTHRTVLGGTEKQTIYFDDSSSHFNILEATNNQY